MLVIATKNTVLLSIFLAELHDAYPILECSNIDSLRPALTREQPGAAFIDPRLAGHDDVHLIRSLCLQHRHIPIVAAAWHADGELPFLRAGARGLLNSDTPVSLYSRMVRTVLDGEMWFSRHAISLFLQELGLVRVPGLGVEQGAASLSDREMEVARLAIDGTSNRAIAQALFITERTVKAHMTHIYEKLGITRRSELFLLQERLLRSPGPGAMPRRR